MSDSLDTFASFVNTACESDLDGEVESSSLSSLSKFRSWWMKNVWKSNQPKVLDLAVTEEGVPSLGRDGSTYQEYIVPAFLTQV